MHCKTVNLERGMPTVAQAAQRLSQELRICKANRAKALKVIHGYGSSGKGGAIKQDVLRTLEEKKRSGFIRHYVRGEEFTAFHNAGRIALDFCPFLSQDSDYGRLNDGVTIVIF